MLNFIFRKKLSILQMIFLKTQKYTKIVKKSAIWRLGQNLKILEFVRLIFLDNK